ncbi:unnamed protein product, partial [marine sediment metagenome]
MAELWFCLDPATRASVWKRPLWNEADSVKDTHIDWGTGADQVSAVDIPILDAGGYYTGAEIETALQEVGAELAVLNLFGK